MATMSVFYRPSSRAARGTDNWQQTTRSTPGIGFVMTRRGARGKAVLFDYWTLTKPEVNLLIVMTTLAGFWLASPLPPSWGFRLFNTSSVRCSSPAALGRSISTSSGASMDRCDVQPCVRFQLEG